MRIFPDYDLLHCSKSCGTMIHNNCLSWCFEPSQPQRITSGLMIHNNNYDDDDNCDADNDLVMVMMMVLLLVVMLILLVMVMMIMLMI